MPMTLNLFWTNFFSGGNKDSYPRFLRYLSAAEFSGSLFIGKGGEHFAKIYQPLLLPANSFRAFLLVS
jgi:hypothetical protein